MTVSRVLNDPDTVAPETRSRVENAIEALQYVPNRLGQSLRSKRSMVIALVVSDLASPFAIKQIRGVSKAARAAGFNVIFTHTNSSFTEELEQLRSLVEHRVDGVVLSPVFNTPESTRFLQDQGLPVVVLDYPMPDNDVDTVRCDSISAARDLTEHLIALGHTKIAMLSGPEAIVTARERATGYSESMRAHGLEPAVQFGSYTPQGGYRMAKDALKSKDRPTALVTANNFIAEGASRAALELGISIPGDVSIATFDSLSPDDIIDPFFTGIVQPVESLASLAMTMLLERILGTYTGPGRERILSTTFELHSSTGPVPSV